MTKQSAWLEEITVVFETIGNSIKKMPDSSLRVPTEAEIYHYLETYGYDKTCIGQDIRSIQEEIIGMSLESMPKQNECKAISVAGGYTTVASKDKVAKEIGDNDVIWLHLAVVTSELLTSSKLILDFLSANQMSYTLKVPGKIGPDVLILGVYSKEDAQNIIDFCGQNQQVYESLMCNNPFMPHYNCVGVVKEISGRSYTHHVAQLLHEYFCDIIRIIIRKRSVDERWGTLEDFAAYVESRFDLSKKEANFFIRYLNSQVALGLKCIHGGLNYLNEVDHLVPILYDKTKIDSYKQSYKNNAFVYSFGDDEITAENNYPLWLELQAYNCIQRMYYEQHNEVPKESDVLSARLTGKLSRASDDALAGQYSYTPLGFHDTMIAQLYPCLVAYNAYSHKPVTIEETHRIEADVRKKIINKTPVAEANKNFYTIDGKTIASTVPPLKIEGCLIGIEYLDYAEDYCNIFILRKGEVETHLDIFLDEVEKAKIWDSNTITSSLYRAGLARVLSDIGKVSKETMNKGSKTGTLLHIAERMKTMKLTEASQEEVENYRRTTGKK